jgi:pyruvate dehydrogenase phosphatase
MLPELAKASDDVEAREKFVAMAAPASAGAVAASMVFDAENNGLYVACAGDCRAVAVWQRADGSWRCDTLTEDQMGENPKEVAR